MQPFSNNYVRTGLNTFDKLIARQPGIFPAFMTGAGPAAVARSLLGVGAGYLGGSLLGNSSDSIDGDKAKKRMALLGAGAGLVASLPDLSATLGSGRGLLDGQFAHTAPGMNKASSAKPQHWIGSYFNDTSLSKRIKQIQSNIDPKDVAADGLETKPHVTLLYGIHTQNQTKISDVLKHIKPFDVTLGKLSIFKKPDSDVLKAEVHADAIHAAHKHLKNHLPNNYQFDTYKPHITIGYLKPGTAYKYLKHNHIKGHKLHIKNVTFNTKNKAISKRHYLTKKAGFDTMSGLPTPPPWMPTFGINQFGQDHISVNTAANTLLSDTTLMPAEKAVAFQILSDASNGQDTGLVSTGDLVKGAINAGLGYMAGKFVGKAFGGLFGLPASTQRRIAQFGAVGNVLRNL